MGFLSAIYSMNGMSIEYAVLDVLDLVAQRAISPSVDDLMGTPFLPNRGDGIGQRTRPAFRVTIRAKVSSFPKDEEQILDQVGLDPRSLLWLTLYEEDLIAKGLLVNGVLRIKSDDRLIRLLESDGIQAPTKKVRAEFAANGRVGLRCMTVRRGLTGERLVRCGFEQQQTTASGLGS